MNRRSFLGTTVSALGTLSTRRLVSGDRLDRIGLQLHTVHDDFTRDPEGTLAAIRAIGYREVELYELYGPEGWTAPRLRAALDHAGLTASAVHVTSPFLYRGIDRHADAAAALGCAYIVCGRLDAEERRTQTDWHELAGVFNRAGETVKHAGLRLGYLNHDYPFDILLGETDPALVSFEMEPYAFARSGGDPVRYLDAHHGRFFGLHLGQAGTLDARRLLQTARAAGVERFYVEDDTLVPPGMESARRSYSYLRGLQW